jgi:hypothetical protein
VATLQLLLWQAKADAVVTKIKEVSLQLRWDVDDVGGFFC